MIANGIEDDEKWLTEGIAGIQHNAFYMHRALEDKHGCTVSTSMNLSSMLETFYPDWALTKIKSSTDQKNKLEAENQGLLLNFGSQLDQSLKDLHKTILGSVSQQQQQLRCMEEHVSSFLASKYDATQILESRICEPEIAVSSVKSSGSVSPRLQQKKLELEKRSRLPTPPDSSKSRRPKSENLQQIDDQSGEISYETRNSSYLEDDISMRSNGNIVSDSGIDTEVTSLECCAETNGSQSPSMKAAKYSVSGIDYKFEGQNKTARGQIKLKEAALDTLANSFLEKGKDLQDKIEELERRLDELSQNSASFYEYQFQKVAEVSEDIPSNGCIHEEVKTKDDNLRRDQENLGELLSEMALLKERNKSMEGELKEVQERYSEISLKFAEVEAKLAARLNEDGVLPEFGSVAPEHRSPVSVLDDTMYRDDALSPVKQMPDVLKAQIWSITLGSSGKRQSYPSTISTRPVLQR
ncbi:unnamed protein product [Camellia sinensis]